jgi:hypothetical protein
VRLPRPLSASPGNTALFAYGAETLYGGTRSPDNGMHMHLEAFDFRTFCYLAITSPSHS